MAVDDVDPAFAALMVKLAEAWGAKLTEHRIRVYARALSDLTMEQLKVACGRAVKESEFFPSVALLRQCADMSVEDAAILGWAAARRAAEDLGAYVSVTFEDGAIATALEAAFGGWSAFCEAEEGPALHARRQEFLAAYRAARRQRAKPRRLAGWLEAGGASQPPARSLTGVVRRDGRAELVDPSRTKRLKGTT
ncbi:MAG TPA: hypothetical protein VFN64_07075 [Burkholderiaceae bacterium]|nr:hypothetical protein [Burkholderiaceae bacterium]